MTRSLEMMRLAARFIRQHAGGDMMHYDGADCDGYCVAEDLENAADELEGNLARIIKAAKA